MKVEDAAGRKNAKNWSKNWRNRWKKGRSQSPSPYPLPSQHSLGSRNVVKSHILFLTAPSKGKSKKKQKKKKPQSPEFWLIIPQSQVQKNNKKVIKNVEKGKKEEKTRKKQLSTHLNHVPTVKKDEKQGKKTKIT